GGLGAAEEPERPGRVPVASGGESLRGPIEGLVPGRRSQATTLPHQRFGQPSVALAHGLPPPSRATARASPATRGVRPHGAMYCTVALPAPPPNGADYGSGRAGRPIRKRRIK